LLADDAYAGLSLRIDHNMAFATLTSLTSFDNFQYRHKTDLDGIASMNLQEIAPFLGFDINDTWQQANVINQFEDFEVDQITQELRLTSTGTRDLQWLVGVFYAAEEVANITGYGSDNFALFILAPFGYGAPIENTGAAVNHEFSQENTSYAAFVQLDYALSNKTNISFGTRYTQDEKEFVNQSYGLNREGERVVKMFPYAVDPQDQTTFKQTADFSHVSWKIGADYKLADDWMVYAAISDGFKSGGFPGNIPFAEADSAVFDEEVIIAYELGTKLSALDNTFRLDAAVFYYDYQDMQGIYAVYTTDGTASFNRLSRIGDAKVSGIEIDSTWQLTNQLTWSLAATVLSTEISDSVEDAADSYNNITSFNGKSLSHAPEKTLTSTLNWSDNISGDLILSIQANIAYKSDFYLGYDNDPSSHWDESSLTVGTRIVLSNEDDTWSVALWGRNITDEVIPAYQSFSLAKSDHFVFYNQPATFGIDFNYRFEE